MNNRWAGNCSLFVAYSFYIIYNLNIRGVIIRNLEVILEQLLSGKIDESELTEQEENAVKEILYEAGNLMKSEYNEIQSKQNQYHKQALKYEKYNKNMDKLIAKENK